MKTYAYFRVSTIDQDTGKFEHDILKFANDKGLGKVEIVEEKVSGSTTWRNRPELSSLVEKVKAGDVIVVPELTRLGRSLLDVLGLLDLLAERDVKVFSVKENFQLNGKDVQSKVMRTMLSLFAEMERDWISVRTKEALAALKKKGRKLGRPKGYKKSKLDPYKQEIYLLLRNGATQTHVARKFKCSIGTIHKFVKKHELR